MTVTTAYLLGLATLPVGGRRRMASVPPVPPGGVALPVLPGVDGAHQGEAGHGALPAGHPHLGVRSRSWADGTPPRMAARP